MRQTIKHTIDAAKQPPAMSQNQSDGIHEVPNQMPPIMTSAMNAASEPNPRILLLMVTTIHPSTREHLKVQPD